MSTEAKNNWVCFGLGVFSLMLLLILVPGTVMSDAYNKRKACEAKLPRNQYCTMIYVPEKQK